MELYVNKVRYRLNLLSPTHRSLTCNKCGARLRLSEPQYNGSEAVRCTVYGCDFEATVNFAQELEKAK